jgi:FlaA1/EpsC-like NDP-sugar epimerase
MCTLIFGGTGSLGTELTKYILSKNGYAIVASRDEAKHWELKNKFQNNKNIESHICDVRDVKRVKEVILETKPNQIIIAQALKQVDTCERFPEESIETNINGTFSLLEAVRSLQGKQKIHFHKT